MRATQRVLQGAVVASAVCLGLTACSSGSRETAPTTTVPTVTTSPEVAPNPVPPVTKTVTQDPTTPEAPQGPTQCQDKYIRISYGDLGAAAGHTYLPIQFTNVGTESCTLYGYPGVSAVENGQQVGLPAARDKSVMPTTVVIKPNAMATATLAISNPHNYDSAECGTIRDVVGIRIYTPNSFTPITVGHDLSVCTDIVTMTVRPVAG